MPTTHVKKVEESGDAGNDIHPGDKCDDVDIEGVKWKHYTREMIRLTLHQQFRCG